MNNHNSVTEIRKPNASATVWLSIAVMYFLFTLLDSNLVFFNDRLSTIPLASGIAFIAVYRLGMAASVMVFVISVVSQLWIGSTFYAAMAWSIYYILNAVIGAALLKRILKQSGLFDTSQSVIIFIVVTAFGPFMLTSLSSQFLIDQFGPNVLPGAPGNFLIWWFGGFIGCIVSAPLFYTTSLSRSFTRNKFEPIILFGFSIVLAAIFSGWVHMADNEFPLQYLIFPLLLWAVFRCSFGIAIIILLISIAATLMGTTQGFGTFVQETIGQTSFLLQAFFGVTGITVLILHATFLERRTAENDLRAAHRDLELRVVERTAEMRAARNEAEEANKTKSRFLTAVSHDLRQPIHVISLFSGALRAKLTNKENLNLVSKIQSSLNNLDSMLDGLMDMSRLENHAIVPQLDDVFAQALLNEIESVFTIEAEAKNLSLKVIPTSAIIRTDQALLARILGNLVANAIRYTNHGKVLVGCRLQRDNIIFEVWDTGSGISKADLKHIFTPYKQFKNTKSHVADGLGLGLSIVDGFTNLLGHSISVRSTVDKGSVFSVEVPRGTHVVDQRDVKKAIHSFTEPFNGHTVLVVDDDEDTLKGMEAVLSDWGCDVVVAHNSLKALDEAEALGENLDVIISDYHLSDDETCYTMLEDINRKLDRNVPAIIISGNTQPERRRQIENAGHFLLTKPIQLMTLRPLLRRQLGLNN